MPEAKKPAAARKTPAKAEAPKAEAPPAKERFSVPKDVIYVASGNYSPKAEHNVESYQAICAVLPAKYEDMVKEVPKHTDVIGYLIRRGALVPKS